MRTLLFTIALFISVNLFSATGSQTDTLNKAGSHLYLKTQYAGNVGLVSAGAGGEFFNSRFSVDLNYGYLPKFINGVHVHSFSVKPAFRFKEHPISGLTAGCYSGIVFSYSIASNTFADIPSCYPEGYYLPNAFHLHPFVGTRLKFTSDNSRPYYLSLFTELGTTDYELLCALKNKEIRFYDIWNICFGLEIHLKSKKK